MKCQFTTKETLQVLLATEEEIMWPIYTDKLDYELELAAVIAKPGKNIHQAQALEHVFGFTILNDISARDIQKKEMKVRLGQVKEKTSAESSVPLL